MDFSRICLFLLAFLVLIFLPLYGQPFGIYRLFLHNILSDSYLVLKPILDVKRIRTLNTTIHTNKDLIRSPAPMSVCASHL
jgi:hypothetical protein